MYKATCKLKFDNLGERTIVFYLFDSNQHTAAKYVDKTYLRYKGKRTGQIKSIEITEASYEF